MPVYAQRLAASVPRGAVSGSAVQRRTAASQALSIPAPAAGPGHRSENPGPGKSEASGLRESLERAARFGHNFASLAPVEERLEPTGLQPPIQRVCTKCGSSKHKTNACNVSKQERDEHAESVKSFKAAKEKTIQDLKDEERKEDTKKGGFSQAFKEKHMKSKGGTLDQSAKKVASTRKWGRGADSGTSTVINMNEEQAKQEARFQVEGLKFNEATVNPETGGLAANFGVNKPTKFDYLQKTSKVVTGRDGKRVIQEGESQLAKPILGMQGTNIHHLHGVDEIE